MGPNFECSESVCLFSSKGNIDELLQVEGMFKIHCCRVFEVNFGSVDRRTVSDLLQGTAF